MNLELAGSVAVIVGGGRGIGAATACAFAAEGAHVAVLDRVPGGCEKVQAARSDPGTTVLPLQVDIADFGAVQGCATRVVQELGGVNHVVNAAAIGSGKFGFPFLSLEPSDWRPVIEVNLFGTVNVAHAFAPILEKRGAGTMVFFASVAGQIGSQTDPPYSAAKAAVINFVQCMAKDLGPYGVRVNALSPGMVETPLNRSVWAAWNKRQSSDSRRSYEEWAQEKVEAVAPLGRLQEPREIAEAVVFLASERARNITGQTLNVDGGQVMHA